MADLRQMLNRISMDLGDPNITDSTKEEHNQAQLAIVDAVTELRHEEFWFNTANHTFATVADQETYALTAGELPTDLISILNDYLYMEVQQNSTTVWQLPRTTNERYDEQTAIWTTPSTPRRWRYFNELLWLTPTTTQVHNINFRYLQDIGTPAASWDGADWTFEANTFGANSEWFNEAEALIRQRTCYALCMGYLNDDGRAQKYLQRALETQQDLSQRKADMDHLPAVEGYL